MILTKCLDFLLKNVSRHFVNVKLGHHDEKSVMRQKILNDKHKKINLNNNSWSIYEKNKR